LTGHVVAEPDLVHPLAIDLHLRVDLQRLLERVLVADRRDDVGRRVDPALEDEGVADAPDRGRGDDPLVLDHHGLGPTRPHRVDDRLHVLLVDHDVVGTVGLGQ